MAETSSARVGIGIQFHNFTVVSFDKKKKTENCDTQRLNSTRSEDDGKGKRYSITYCAAKRVHSHEGQCRRKTRFELFGKQILTLRIGDV